MVFALQEAGWILRSDVVWHKPNPMPESTKDRPTRAHEFVFLLTKNKRYYYDAEAIAEPVKSTAAEKGNPRYGGHKQAGGRTYSGTRYEERQMANKRDVWTIAPAGSRSEHGAVSPEALVRPCVLAGSRPGDLVLDPFAGTGTTGRVAAQEGRRFTGIEINEGYVE